MSKKRSSTHQPCPCCGRYCEASRLIATLRGSAKGLGEEMGRQASINAELLEATIPALNVEIADLRRQLADH